MDNWLIKEVWETAAVHVVVTGQAGLEKAKFFKKVKALADGSGKSLKVYPLEAEFKRTFGQAEAPFYWDTYFKNQRDFVGKYSTALEKALAKVQQDRALNAILDIHALYRRQGIPFCAMNFKHLQEFRPDMFVTLVDDIYRVRKRIREHPASKVDKATAQITLKDVIDWRSEEIMVTEIMANFVAAFEGCSSAHYVIPIRGHEEVLYQLVFESKEALGSIGEWKPKVYIAFPITKAYKDPQLKRERDNFRERMKERDLGLIVFDPYEIEERLLVAAVEGARLTSTLQKLELPRTVTLLTSEGEEYEIDRTEGELVGDRDVQSQVATRDYRLISQSDFLVAFRPDMSGGVKSEIQHAHQLGKPVYAVWPASARPKDDFEHLAITQQTETTEEMVRLIGHRSFPILGHRNSNDAFEGKGRKRG